MNYKSGSGILPQDAVHTESGIGFFGDVHRYGSSRSGMRLHVLDSGLDDGTAPPKKLGWKTVGLLQIADVVGSGILTMAAAFVQLGWVCAVLVLVVMCAINVYMGIVLSQAKQIVPGGLSYKQMAHYAVGKKWFTLVVEWVFIIYVVANLSGYVLAMTESLQMIFFDSEVLCNPVAGIIVAGVMIFPTQIRSLHGITLFVYLNCISIVVSVFTALIYMIVNMQKQHEEHPSVTEVIPTPFEWTDFFNGVCKITFAYLGAYIYLEMMSEMRRPQDFPKGFLLSAPFQFGMYLFVGVTGYLYSGQNAGDMIIQEINVTTNPALFRFAAVLLYIHLIVSFLIKSTVLTRAIHIKVSPMTVNDTGLKGRLVWFVLSISLIISTYLISNAIPLFGKITSILGGLFAPLLGYIFPPIFLLAARRRSSASTSTLEYVVFAIIMVLACVLLSAGTVANFISFFNAMKQTQTTPFECKHSSYLDRYT